MANKDNEPIVYETTEVFHLTGAEIKRAIHERVKRHEEEQGTCLTKISDILVGPNEAVPGRNVAKSAAFLLMTLSKGTNLTENALVVQALVDRAVFLSNECYDLGCIAKNIRPDAYYKVPLESAKRYGLI